MKVPQKLKIDFPYEWIKNKWYTQTHTYTHHGILLSHNKNEILWMELEDIMPSGISQTEKRNAILKKTVKTDSQTREQTVARGTGVG